MPPTDLMKKSSTATTTNSPVNVKLLLIGNASVGKSSLLLRFSDEQWLPEDEASATIGVDFRVRLSFRAFSHWRMKSCAYPSWYRCTRWRSTDGKWNSVYGCVGSFFPLHLCDNDVCSAGYSWPRTIPYDHILILPWCSRDRTWCVLARFYEMKVSEAS